MDDMYVATWLSSCVCGQLLSSVDGTGSLALFTSGVSDLIFYNLVFFKKKLCLTP